MQHRSLLTLLFLALAEPAAAQVSNICEDLRGQIASLPEVIGNGPEVRQYAKAITEQNFELRRLRVEMRQNGCSTGSVIVIGRGNADYCAGLQADEARMSDNIRYLEDRRQDIRSEGGDDYRIRRQLQAALRQNGCVDQDAVQNSDNENDQSSISTPEQQAMRTDTFIPPSTAEGRQTEVPAPSLMAHINTICVRTCDGGFFPVTSNTTSIDFGRDADTCSKMCPGIPTELFYQDVGNGDAAAMISTKTGAPYSALPNAFGYKNRKPGEKSACSCDLAAYYDRMRRNQSLATEAPNSSGTKIQAAPSKGAPPTAPATPIQLPPVPDRPYDPAQNTVRQVGPQFFAGDQGSIDLKKPAKPGPQPQQ
ncbi:DUF2865 domain-containing protein [Oryzifoliimicrobium ureilyticus]|uniref:DUF2865 domain-containing protein n=1 Tax=Oryzifoliimicrobium ureilyticus TaxID=3113724 RepID=UPI0030762A34